MKSICIINKYKKLINNWILSLWNCTDSWMLIGQEINFHFFFFNNTVSKETNYNNNIIDDINDDAFKG